MSKDAQMGIRLKEVRNSLGWSQQKAADAVGVRREMWAKYEAGAEPGAKAIAGMINAGLDVTYILTGQRGRTEGAPALKPDEEALLDNYRNAPKDQQDILKATSAAFAQSGREMKGTG